MANICCNTSHLSCGFFFWSSQISNSFCRQYDIRYAVYPSRAPFLSNYPLSYFSHPPQLHRSIFCLGFPWRSFRFRFPFQCWSNCVTLPRLTTCPSYCNILFFNRNGHTTHKRHTNFTFFFFISSFIVGCQCPLTEGVSTILW